MDEPPSRRKTGLLWSPADDRLNVGIVCRDFSVDDWIRVKASLLAVLGPTFCASSAHSRDRILAAGISVVSQARRSASRLNQEEIVTEREKEHRDIADSFGGRPFTRSEFKQRYRDRYPGRKPGAMIPSDYCVNLNPKGAEGFTKFLRWLKRGWYTVA